MWFYWFNGSVEDGINHPLKETNKKTHSKAEKSTFNERANVGREMEKYVLFEEFAVAYDGYTRTFTMLRYDIRKRKQTQSLNS